MSGQLIGFKSKKRRDSFEKFILWDWKFL